MEKILLDTHVFIWMITAENKLSNSIHKKITEYLPGRRVLLSAITVWEIAVLVQKRRLQLSLPIKAWVEQALTTPGLTVVPLSTAILLESCLLPGDLHDDPADRMIIATARLENAALITRDSRILEYSKQGFIISIRA